MEDRGPAQLGRANGEGGFLRSAVHVSLALSLLYYAVPDPIPPLSLPKAPAALAFALVVTLVEAWRIRTGWTFFLFRDYESHRPAAYYWLGLGCLVALVFFPARFAVLTILGVCLVDPVIGQTRWTPAKKWASAVGACAWAGLGAAVVLLAPLAVPLWLLPLGAAAAAAGEAVRSPFVDDDFLMNMVPLLTLTAVAQALGI